MDRNLCDSWATKCGGAHEVHCRSSCAVSNVLELYIRLTDTRRDTQKESMLHYSATARGQEMQSKHRVHGLMLRTQCSPTWHDMAVQSG